MIRRLTTVVFLTAMLALLSACGDSGGHTSMDKSGQKMQEMTKSHGGMSGDQKKSDHKSKQKGGGGSHY